MYPAAALARNGATPGQAATSAPRALLCLAARWGRPGDGPLVPELPEWRAVHVKR
jgi:hypothetical protein